MPSTETLENDLEENKENGVGDRGDVQPVLPRHPKSLIG
jgi:hypothetical protein